MPEFKADGEELICKTVVRMGNGACVYVPKKWIGRNVMVILSKEPR